MDFSHPSGTTRPYWRIGDITLFRDGDGRLSVHDELNAADMGMRVGTLLASDGASDGYIAVSDENGLLNWSPLTYGMITDPPTIQTARVTSEGSFTTISTTTLTTVFDHTVHASELIGGRLCLTCLQPFAFFQDTGSSRYIKLQLLRNASQLLALNTTSIAASSALRRGLLTFSYLPEIVGRDRVLWTLNVSDPFTTLGAWVTQSGSKDQAAAQTLVPPIQWVEGDTLTLKMGCEVATTQSLYVGSALLWRTGDMT